MIWAIFLFVKLPKLLFEEVLFNMDKERFEKWQELRMCFSRQLADLKYSVSYMKLVKNTLNQLEAFMLSRESEIYSDNVGEDFLAGEQKRISHGYHEEEKAAIHRLDDFLAGRPFRKVPNRAAPQCPICFSAPFELYTEDLESRGLRRSTVEKYRKLCVANLIVFNKAGICDIANTEAWHVLEAFKISNDKHAFISVFRGFFKLIRKLGFHEKDLSVFLPTVKSPTLVPSIYSKAETDAMMAGIDRGTNIGKRDYAVNLLALKLGMRRGDIAGLKFRDVDFNAKRVRFIQEKTGVAQNLFLPRDAESALNDYINGARPESALPYIFLTVKAPTTRLFGTNLYRAVDKNLKKAGIDIGNRKRGPHSLRMTLASELISEKTPYDVVRRILGQEDPDSTKRYVRFDIEILRTCALEVSEPTGLLAKTIGATEKAVIK
jgi:integrase